MRLTKRQEDELRNMPAYRVICIPGEAQSILIRDVIDTIDALEQEAKAGEAAALSLVADYCDAFNQPPNISIAAASIKRKVEGLISPDAGRALDAHLAAANMKELMDLKRIMFVSTVQEISDYLEARLTAHRKAAGGSDGK